MLEHSVGFSSVFTSTIFSICLLLFVGLFSSLGRIDHEIVFSVSLSLSVDSQLI